MLRRVVAHMAHCSHVDAFEHVGHLIFLVLLHHMRLHYRSALWAP